MNNSAENRNFEANAINSEIVIIIDDSKKLFFNPNLFIMLDESIAPQNAPIKSKPAKEANKK